MTATPDLARVIAQRLRSIDGVVAVALGGSWARGEARSDSDVDLGVYYHPDQRPSVRALRELARELDDRHEEDLVTDFGEWGPWIDGGAWLRIDGQRVDWLYRDLQRVRRAIDDAREGRSSCHYQPGHPHGFHTHMYMGEVHYCLPLHDPGSKLAALQSLTESYPPLLKTFLIDTYLWEAGFALETAEKPAKHGDAFYVSGCLFRCVACLVQVLFALNERYFVNEKGAMKTVGLFPLHPRGFAEVISELLASPGQDVRSLCSSLERTWAVVADVRSLCRR